MVSSAMACRVLLLGALCGCDHGNTVPSECVADSGVTHTVTTPSARTQVEGFGVGECVGRADWLDVGRDVGAGVVALAELVCPVGGGTP